MKIISRSTIKHSYEMFQCVFDQVRVGISFVVCIFHQPSKHHTMSVSSHKIYTSSQNPCPIFTSNSKTITYYHRNNCKQYLRLCRLSVHTMLKNTFDLYGSQIAADVSQYSRIGRKHTPVMEINASFVFDLYNMLHKECSQRIKSS